MKYVLVACLALFLLGCGDPIGDRQRAERKVSRECLVCCKDALNQLDCAVEFHKQLHAIDDNSRWAAITYCPAWLRSYRAPKSK